MQAIRALLFTVFQLVVTPLYAALMLATFWLPRLARYRIAANWCQVGHPGRELSGARLPGEVEQERREVP